MHKQKASKHKKITKKKEEKKNLDRLSQGTVEEDLDSGRLGWHIAPKYVEHSELTGCMSASHGMD